PKDPKRDRHAPLPGDGEQVREWRTRMGTEPAKAVYRQRASTAECVNAQARNRGLLRLLVRGVQKVKAVALWFGIAHNVVCGLGPVWRSEGGGRRVAGGQDGGRRAPCNPPGAGQSPCKRAGSSACRRVISLPSLCPSGSKPFDSQALRNRRRGKPEAPGTV